MASLQDSQLSAIAATIEDLSGRVASLAEDLQGDGWADPATALFEVERSLRMAQRSIDRARRGLPD